jgi:hypothetical protein
MDIDFNKIKRKLNIKLDLYDEYKVEKKEEDLRKITDVQEAIKETADMCFRACVNLDEPDFSKKEDKCVRNCVVNAIQGLEHLMRKYEIKSEDN